MIETKRGTRLLNSYMFEPQCIKGSIKYHLYFFVPSIPGIFSPTESPDFFWLGPSTALSTVPAIPPFAASNWLPIAPSLENGPPIFSPIWPIFPSAVHVLASQTFCETDIELLRLNCLPIAPPEERIDGS